MQSLILLMTSGETVHRQVRIPAPLLALDSGERSLERSVEPQVLWPTPTSSVVSYVGRRRRLGRQRLAFAVKEHLVFDPKDETDTPLSRSPMRRAQSLKRWSRHSAFVPFDLRDSPSDQLSGLFIGRPQDLSPCLTPIKSRERLTPDLQVMDYYKRLSTRPEHGFRTPNTHQRKAASRGGYRTKLQKDPVICRSALGIYEYVDSYEKDEGFLKRMQSAVKQRRKCSTKV